MGEIELAKRAVLRDDEAFLAVMEQHKEALYRTTQAAVYISFRK